MSTKHSQKYKVYQYHTTLLAQKEVELTGYSSTVAVFVAVADNRIFEILDFRQQSTKMSEVSLNSLISVIAVIILQLSRRFRWTFLQQHGN